MKTNHAQQPDTRDCISIGVATPQGCIDGCVTCSDDGYLTNWLHKCGVYEQALAHWFSVKYDRVAIMDHLEVEYEFRNQGHGRELFDAFALNALQRHASVILLAADTTERQEHGFVLLDWYRSLGFHLLPASGYYPLMLKNLTRRKKETTL